MDESQWGRAIEVLTSNAAEVRRSWELTWNLGWCHFKLGDFEAAVSALSLAVDLKSDHPVTHWALGVACMKAERLDQACVSLETSLQLKDQARTRQALGLLYRLQGRLSEAESLYSEGLKTLPHSPAMFEIYGDFLCDTGEPENAEIYYKRAEQLRERLRERQ